MYYWDKPQFYGVRAAAANIAQGVGTYTQSMFHEDFPQFFNSDGVPLAPETILNEFITQANNSIQPEKWGDGWRYAAGLYVAHYATLYLRTYAPSSDTASQAAATGSLIGVVSKATLGDASVSYDVDALTKATEKWGDLNATQYGQMLASRARFVGMGGTLVI